MEKKENQLSTIIIGACIEIHKELGPGLLESVYEEVLAYELRQRGSRRDAENAEKCLGGLAETRSVWE